MLSLVCWFVTIVLLILPCHSDQGLTRLTEALRDENGNYYAAPTDKGNGYLQMKVGEEWRTVNAEGFGEDELAVACHQLGFPRDSTHHMEKVTLAPGVYLQDEFVDNVDCDADAQELQDCAYDFNSKSWRDALEVTCAEKADSEYTMVTDANSCEAVGMETITTLSQCAEAVSALDLADNINRGDIPVTRYHDRKDGCIWDAQAKEATLFFDSTRTNEPCNYQGYAGCLCARSAISSPTDSTYPLYFHLNITFQETAGSNGAEAFEIHSDKITEVLSQFLTMEFKTDISAIFIGDMHLSAEVKYEISTKSERQVAKEIDDVWFEIEFPLKLILKGVSVLSVDTIQTSWERDFYQLESSSTLLGGFLTSCALLFIFF